MKITLCTCNNAINLDFERIRKELEKRGILCKIESALCKNETSWNDGIIAACSKKYLLGSDFDIRKISIRSYNAIMHNSPNYAGRNIF